MRKWWFWMGLGLSLLVGCTIANESRIVGRWEMSWLSSTSWYTFNADGTFAIEYDDDTESSEGTYSLTADELTLHYDGGEEALMVYEFPSTSTLSLTATDGLGLTVILTRA